jgi:hypothetical protein
LGGLVFLFDHTARPANFPGHDGNGDIYALSLNNLVDDEPVAMGWTMDRSVIVSLPAG